MMVGLGGSGGFSRSSADRWAGDRRIFRQIVANNCMFPIGSASSSGTQYMSEMTLYCPRGVESMSLYFAGVRTSTATETNLTGASPCYISYAVTPAPWNPTRTYAVGDQVTWNMTQYSGYSGNPIYTAAAASTGSMPGPGNADWSAGTAPVRQLCTTKGHVTLGARTTTLGDGTTTVTEGWFKTDPFQPMGATSECYIAVRVWLQNGGGFAFASGTGYVSGSFFESGVTTTDRTLSGVTGSPSQFGGSSLIRPALAVGVPAVAGNNRTVAIIGDSIATGTNTGSSATAVSVVSGGSGFTTADIGKFRVIDNTGGTATSCSTPVIVCITNVSAGAVTGVRLWHPGSYANSGLPSGTQGTTNYTSDLAAIFGGIATTTAGTGLTLSVTFGASNGGFDTDPRTYASGYIQRGLSDAGVCWMALTSPGDTLQGWVSRSYTRFSLLQEGAPSSAIVELGINDITAGRTIDQIKADASAIYHRLRGAGVLGIYQTTILPFPSSTDGWVTLGNQSAGAQNSVAQAFNTWIRAGADGLIDGYIDAAAAVEDGGSSAPTGKVIVNGTIGYVLIDGKHPTPRIIPTLAAVVQAYVPNLK